MMAVGTSKCNHCKLDFDGHDLDYHDDKGYCFDCQAKLGRYFCKTYAMSLQDKAKQYNEDAKRITDALEAAQ